LPTQDLNHSFDKTDCTTRTEGIPLDNPKVERYLERIIKIVLSLLDPNLMKDAIFPVVDSTEN
jgi:hypothetical protein